MHTRKSNIVIGCLAASLVILVGVATMGGCSSDPGAPEPDTTPPGIVDATATRFHRIEVLFDERVERTSAENTSNYLVVKVSPTAARYIPGKDDGERELAAPGDTIGVLSASLDPGGRKVVLTTDPLEASAQYQLFVSGVKDLSDNEGADDTKTVVSQIASGNIYTIVGTGFPALGGENMDPKLSECYLPQDMTVGPDGLLYVVDWNNHRVRVVENGLIRTIIGTGLLGDADPGNGVDIGLNHPTNVSFDNEGRLYMAAWHNSKVMVYDLATRFCDVYVGKDGFRWWDGDGGPSEDAAVNLPSSTMIGPDGNLYISDQANFCVRMVDRQTGVITTVVAASQCSLTACLPGFCGDGGPAVDACIDAPRGQAAAPASRLEFDRFGNLYLADTGNHRVRVVDAGGTINTIAGNGTRGFSGDGGNAIAAQLDFPADVACGPDGSVYIADKDNHCVRKVSGGIITTVAGTGGSAGYRGDGGLATGAFLHEPFGIHVDSEGDLYIADTKNHVIRVVYR